MTDEPVRPPHGGVMPPARWAVLAIGALAGLTLVGRPLGLGTSIAACALLIVAAIAAPRRDAWSIAWWLAAAALASMATVRAAGWVVWPSLIAAAGLASLAAAGGARWWALAVGLARATRLDAGIVLVLRVLTGPRRSWRPHLVGAGIGVLLLATFVPLFAAADAAFAHLLGELVPDGAFDTTAARLATWLGVAAVGGALLRSGVATAPAEVPPPRGRLAGVEWTLPLAVLVALFAAFVALQITTFFAGHEYVLRTADLTYAEYAREGFAQLLVVAALTLAVIAAAARWAPDTRVKRCLLGALCALTLVVLASALERLDLYMDAYGFTRLRLTAQATILWLGAVFVLLLLAHRAAWLPRAAVTLTAAALLAFAVSDPDRRVAERNVDRYAETGRLDESVLRNLSPDAAPALVDQRALTECPAPGGIAGLNLGRSRAREALGCPG
jgi:hypothetical protein